MSTTSTAHSFLVAADLLIRQAIAAAPDHIGSDLNAALEAIGTEAAHLADTAHHEQNRLIAARLGAGFSYDADPA